MDASRAGTRIPLKPGTKRKSQPVRSPGSRPHREPYGERGDRAVRDHGATPAANRSLVAIVSAHRAEAHDREDHDGETMKQMPLDVAARQEASPVPGPSGNSEVIRQRGAVTRQQVWIAREAHLLLKPEVHEDNRRQHRRDPDTGDREVAEDAPPRQPRPQQLHANHHADREQEEIQVVPVRKSCQQVGGGEHQQPTARSAGKVAMQPQQTDRHPPVHQDLQVVGLRQPIRGQRKGESCQHRGISASPERARQQKHPEARQDVRADVGNVVREHGVAEHPLDRCRENRDAEHVLGVRERPVTRIEKRGIPEAVQPVQQAVRVPRQNGRQNDRVGEADGNRVRRVVAPADRWRAVPRRRM